MAITDRHTACGDMPRTLIQMLASCIHMWEDNKGDKHAMLEFAEVGMDTCDKLSNTRLCNPEDPERFAVENMFALDDCNNLAVKLFFNLSDINMQTCGLDRSLLQFLADTIYRINGQLALSVSSNTYVCNVARKAIDCGYNDPEAIVKGIFGVDSCGNNVMRLVTSEELTDKIKPCFEMPHSFLEMLARCVLVFDGISCLNVIMVTPNDCGKITKFWDCDESAIEPERALVNNVFAWDICGNLGLKIVGKAVIH